MHRNDIKEYLLTAIKSTNLPYDDFIKKVFAALKDKNEQGKDHREKTERVATIIRTCEEAYKTDDPAIILVTLYELLTSVAGSHGPNSFKYTLLEKIFNLPSTYKEHSKEIINLFINILNTLDLEQRRKLSKIMADVIAEMSPQKFVNALDNAHYLKNIMEARLSKPIITYGLFIRAIFVEGASVDVDLNKLGPLDAAHDLFNLFIGETGRHSFKFIFLLHLFGWNVRASVDHGDIKHGTMHACLILSSQEHEQIANYLYSVYAKNNTNASHDIIEELIKAIKTKRQELAQLRHHQMEGFVDLFVSTINKATVIEAIDNALTKRTGNDKEKLEALGSLSQSVHTFFIESKTAERMSQTNTLKSRLGKTEANSLALLINFFENGVGSEGIHSYKYDVLKNLFPKLNDFIPHISNAESKASVKLFIELGKKKLEQTANAAPLDNLTSSKRKVLD